MPHTLETAQILNKDRKECKPDEDNLGKAFKDALFSAKFGDYELDDSIVWHRNRSKWWIDSEFGKIVATPILPDRLPLELMEEFNRDR